MPQEARTTLVGEDTVVISVADSKTAENQPASFAVRLSGTLSEAVTLRYDTGAR